MFLVVSDNLIPYGDVKCDHGFSPTQLIAVKTHWTANGKYVLIASKMIHCSALNCLEDSRKADDGSLRKKMLYSLSKEPTLQKDWIAKTSLENLVVKPHSRQLNRYTNLSIGFVSGLKPELAKYKLSNDSTKVPRHVLYSVY